MESIIHLKFIIMLAAVCWFFANAPLVAAVWKNFGDWDFLWKIFTSSPNRYLYTLIFMPVLFVCVFSSWGLLQHMLSNSQIPENHVLVNIWKFPAILLLSISIASVVTFWDFMAGNYNHADFAKEYARASYISRDLILEQKQLNEDWKLSEQAAEKITNPNKAAKRLINGEHDISLAIGYLNHVNDNRINFVESIMFHTNLVNVWFFVFSTWLAIYLLVILTMTKTTIGIPHKDIFSMIKYFLIFSIYIVSIWTAFRGYEFREFKEYGWISGESIDLFLGLLVILVGSILLSICFEKDMQSIFSFMAFPMTIIFGSFLAFSFVRQWYGSAMTLSNFAILLFAWSATVIILYVLFMKGKA